MLFLFVLQFYVRLNELSIAFYKIPLVYFYDFLKNHRAIIKLVKFFVKFLSFKINQCIQFKNGHVLLNHMLEF